VIPAHVAHGAYRRGDFTTPTKENK
jgi:hypothetical protein